MEAEKAKQKSLTSQKLKEKLKECQKLKDEYLAGWQRARADLLNYKKGEFERVSEILKYANDGLVLKALPILDNFELAFKNLKDDLKKEAAIKGILQIKKQFQEFLRAQGLEEIKAGGEKFDPNLHEAVGEIEVKDKEPGIVVEEVQKGYKLHGKVIRPAKVKISK